MSSNVFHFLVEGNICYICIHSPHQVHVIAVSCYGQFTIPLGHSSIQNIGTSLAQTFGSSVQTSGQSQTQTQVQTSAHNYSQSIGNSAGNVLVPNSGSQRPSESNYDSAQYTGSTEQRDRNFSYGNR